MRRIYQYNKTTDAPGAYGHDATELLNNFVHWKESRYSIFSDKRPIEEQIDTVTEITGKLCDVLISKGLMTHEEFLAMLGLGNSYESRDSI